MQRILVGILCMKEPAACFLLVSCLDEFSTLKMKVLRSSETSVDFYQTIGCYIQDDTLILCSYTQGESHA
jgi:hypothetical protein